MPKNTVTQQDLDKILGSIRKTAVVNCRLTRPLAGGVKTDEKGLKAFIEHHLGIPPEASDFQPTFDRIMREEIGERDTTPEGGEVQTEEVYQINVIRADEDGPYIGEHQIKAMLKQSASRLGIFKAKGKLGSKGDLAECSTVSAHGESFRGDKPWNIYLRDDTDCNVATTAFEIISGRVRTPQGAKSIQHHTESAVAGTRFTFALDWMPTKLTGSDIQSIIAMATQIGLGSCLSLGFGRFEVVSMEVEK